MINFITCTLWLLSVVYYVLYYILLFLLYLSIYSTVSINCTLQYYTYRLTKLHVSWSITFDIKLVYIL